MFLVAIKQPAHLYRLLKIANSFVEFLEFCFFFSISKILIKDISYLIYKKVIR